MEVHHHSHTERKKWTHYLWEFLMLFLAVFCGFLAEYQLEHKIEKDRELQYMQSMLEDLRSDTAMFASNIKQRESRIAMADSLIELLNSPARQQFGNEIYFFARSTSVPSNIFPNDRTILQLKSSGNLRLIRNNKISNHIMTYDQNIRKASFEMGDEVEIRAQYRSIASKLFNMNVFNEMAGINGINRPADNPELFSTDKNILNEFIGAAQYVKRIQMAQLNLSNELLSQAIFLMEDIKKEYHLE